MQGEPLGKVLARQINDGTVVFAGMEAIRKIASYVAGLEAERDALRNAIMGAECQPGMSHGQFLEMAATLHQLQAKKGQAR